MMDNEQLPPAGVRCMCVLTGCRAGPGCPHYCGHCKAHIAFAGRPHDAGSHDQPMTPAVQRVIDEADKRARDKAAMPAACPTPTGCREHGCHGECMPPNRCAQPRAEGESDWSAGLGGW